MAIFVIGDLHLSFGSNKPMDIFGKNWVKHDEKIAENWKENVKDTDTVIINGDFSWAMNIKDMYLDFKYLEELPGKKILSKGNHDYWWASITSMRKYLEENNFTSIDFLHNNSFEIEGKVIVGTRGWVISNDINEKKIFDREANRLELSIKDGINKYGNKEMIGITHYPPITKSMLINNELNDIVRILKKYEIPNCYYGHLHASSINDAVNGEYYGINFKLASCDALDFKLLKIVK